MHVFTHILHLVIAIIITVNSAAFLLSFISHWLGYLSFFDIAGQSLYNILRCNYSFHSSTVIPALLSGHSTLSQPRQSISRVSHLPVTTRHAEPYIKTPDAFGRGRRSWHDRFERSEDGTNWRKQIMVGGRSKQGTTCLSSNIF